MAKTQSIFEVVKKFNTESRCILHLERIRWPNGLECPHCQGKRVMKFQAKGKTGKERSLYECVDCRYQYSVTVGTIFHDSHLPLVKWFLAIYMICSAEKGVSAKQLQRELEIGSYKTAWYMAHRIRLAMHDDPQFCQKYSGVVEIDETYIGGKRSGPRGHAFSNKVAVVGIKKRTSGKIRLKAIQDASERTLANFIRKNVDPGSEMHTHEFTSYLWLDSSEFAHKTVNHSKTYVQDGVHVNGVENVWSLVKRGIMGVFHKVSEKYLPLYLDEFSFRFNNRDAFSMMDRVLTTCS